MEQRAAVMVDQILAKHKTQPLSAEVQAGIQTIIDREQKWIDRQ